MIKKCDTGIERSKKTNENMWHKETRTGFMYMGNYDIYQKHHYELAGNDLAKYMGEN